MSTPEFLEECDAAGQEAQQEAQAAEGAALAEAAVLQDEAALLVDEAVLIDELGAQVHESVVLDEVAVLYDVAVLDEVFVTTMVASEVALLGEATVAVELAVEELEEAAVFEEAMAAAAEANAVPIPPRSLLAAVSDRTGLLGAGEVVVDGGRLFPSVVRQRAEHRRACHLWVDVT